MGKPWKTIGALVVSACWFVWNVPSVRATQCPDRAPVVEEFHIDSPYSMVRRQLQRAIAGAARRLSRCTCQTIFREFLDDSGRSLKSRLDALDQSGAGTCIPCASSIAETRRSVVRTDTLPRLPSAGRMSSTSAALDSSRRSCTTC